MSGSTEPSGGIVGRDAELRVVAEFLAEIPSGFVALAIEGEAGIGKSTVIYDGVGQARDLKCTALVCQPAAAEARMSFAALGDLLEPVIDDLLPELAPAPRRALEVALLRAEPAGSARDERGVSVAFLQAIRLLCQRSAVLIAVDDWQWLDRPTARVIEFATRRLADAPVGLLASVRVDGRERWALDLRRIVGPERRGRLRLGPLSLAALHHVIHAREGAVLPRRMLSKVYELSGGNPFFAIELADVLLGQGAALVPGEPLPMPGGLGELLADRLARLPARGREVLLVASALAQPTATLVEAFDPGLEANEVLAMLERRGLIEISRGRVRFAHPLLSSTVYGGASELDRRRVHRRLSEIVEEPEQRARHLALAARRPDERVAAALERAADMADARGAPDAAAELSELAREATPSDLPKAARRRNLSAAEHHFIAGDWDRARVLVEGVIESGACGLELARALQLLAKVHYYGDSFPKAAGLLREALEHAGEDPSVRAPIELDLAYVSHTFEGFPAAAGYARIALAHGEGLGEPGLLAEALAVVEMAEFLSGQGFDRDRLERTLALEDRTRRVPVNLRPSLIAGMILSWIGESERACALLDELRMWLIDRGEESELVMISAPAVVPALCWRGDLEAAARRAQEAFEAADQLDTDASRGFALSALATANAYLGNVEGRQQAYESIELLRSVGFQIQTFYPLAALGFLHLSLDEPAETDRLLRPVVSMIEHASLAEPSAAPVLPDEIEALIALGELASAESLLGTFQSRAEELDRAVSLAPAWRRRGMLLAARGDHDGALAALERAVAYHERAPRPIELARTLLAFGQVQRRANQRRAARETFEQAVAVFDGIGAARWASRTRRELARLGQRRRAGPELTPTEEQVAQRAAAGMTNREIAGALFISPKTVEANLARVYRKLGIKSRAELGRRVAERERSQATKP